MVPQKMSTSFVFNWYLQCFMHIFEYIYMRLLGAVDIVAEPLRPHQVDLREMFR